MIKRTIYNDIKAHLSQKEISLIVGPRQAGKTTTILALKDELQRAGESTIYFNLDIESDRKYFTSQDDLINKIKLEVGESKAYIFIDEIQRKENAGLFLKGLYDKNLAYKFIVTGSGSVELKEKIHESSMGRKRLFEFTTVSFEEFVHFKTNYRYTDQLQSFFELEKEKTKVLLDEYLRFGGYPKVILAETVEEKQRIMSEIYGSYIERDVQALLGVQNSDAYSNLIRLLAAQIGSQVNISELASTLGITTITINNYLWYLQNTYIISKITPYFTNVRSEISKSPLFYFNDVGFRNYALGTFANSAPQANDSGHLFENLLFNLFTEKTNYTSTTIHYWRTKDRAEVDFILRKGVEVTPIEAKYKTLKQSGLSRSFRNFIIRYAPENAYVIHTGEAMELQVDNTRVEFLPYYRLLSDGSPLKQHY